MLEHLLFRDMTNLSIQTTRVDIVHVDMQNEKHLPVI
jgi:hypothetical protein